MYTIDRSVAIIRPKQPFIDWANRLPDAEEQVSIEDLRDDCTAVLIAECNDAQERKKLINEMALELFESELFSWCTDENWWPQNRTSEMFWDWFDVELHTVVIDPYEDPIEKEDL